MEDFGCEGNMFPWSNINHYQQEIEESIIFGSGNIFLNPVQDIKNTGPTICSSPITSAGDGQIASHSHYAPASLDSINIPSGENGFHKIPLNTTSRESPDCIRHFTLDDSVTKENSIVSQISPEKNPNSNSGYYESNRPRSKKPRSDPVRSASSTINFRQWTSESDETDSEVIAQIKETIYRAAAFRPVSFSDDEPVKKTRRRNVRISNDPQTVAARKRREKVSERIRVLQKLVPGGNKMDTASMLDEAANYLKFLRSQVKALEQFGVQLSTTTNACSTTQNIQSFNDNVMLGVPFPMQTHILLPYQQIYHTPPPS